MLFHFSIATANSLIVSHSATQINQGVESHILFCILGANNSQQTPKARVDRTISLVYSQLH